MPSVNMISARRAEKKRVEKRVKITLYVILCEIAAAFALMSFMVASTYSASLAIERTDSELEKVQPIVEKLHGYQEEIKLLQPRLDLLANSREQTLRWYVVLQNLSQSMPQETWLKTLSSSINTVDTSSPQGVQSSPSMISLKGSTTSQRLVGETMLRLNQFPEFKKVDLAFTQKSNNQNLNIVDFEVSVLLKPIDSNEGGETTNDSNKTL